MQYKQIGKSNIKASILGFGCMRLPVIDTPGGPPVMDQMKPIDEKTAMEMADYALANGVNYFDSAYMYHGGKSEEFLGKALKGRRDKAIVTTKSPVMILQKQEDLERIFSEQLKRLNMDYVDFYLLHGIGRQSWNKCKELKAMEFMEKVKKEGRAKYIGFSFHDDYDSFKEIIDSYDWTLCQIQYNYFDEELQAGRKGLQYAASKGIGVIIMEPLRGGNLTNNLPDEIKNIWNSGGIKRSPAEFALRWLWNQPEVTVVLSGMSSPDQMKENIKSAENASSKPMTNADQELIKKVADTYRKMVKVNCTQCNYCSECPVGIPIPMIFQNYNEYHMFSDINKARMSYNMWTPPDKKANNCQECGECESKCPQQINIIETLKEAHKLFNIDMPGPNPMMPPKKD